MSGRKFIGHNTDRNKGDLPVKSKKRYKPRFAGKNIKPSVKKEDLGSEPIYDLNSNLSLLQLVENLKRTINDTINPSDCFFIWSGERQIKKRRLNAEKQRLIIDEIHLLGLTVDEMARTQAKLFLMPEIIDSIIDSHREDIAWERAEAKKRMELANKQHADTLVTVDDRARERALDLLNREVDIRIKEAEAGIKEEQQSILVKIKNVLNFENPSIEQVLILIKALNPNSGDSLQTLIEKGLADAKVEDIRAGAGIKRKQADEQDIKAKTAKYNLIKSIKEDKEYE